MTKVIDLGLEEELVCCHKKPLPREWPVLLLAKDSVKKLYNFNRQL